MSNLTVLDSKGSAAGTVKLPQQFTEPVRADLIKRAVHAVWSHDRQPYGADPRAGKKAAQKLSKRRRDYKGMYGQGISRTPRKIMSRNGTNMNWVGAFAPNTVGGRKAHPPKASKIWAQKINVKERRKAIRSALAATLVADLVKDRGHRVPAKYPFALAADTEKLQHTADVAKLFALLGLDAELARTANEGVRAGRGKMRGRRAKKRAGPLLVVSGKCPLAHAARNIPGVDVADVRRLNAAMLAPGAHPARLTIFTDKAIEVLAKEHLYGA